MADEEQNSDKETEDVTDISAGDGEPLIISEVLCFIQNHIKRTTKSKIVECVARSFAPDAVMKAKDILANDTRVKGKLKNRRNTNTRMKHEQTADDLVDAMLYLDHTGVETNYVAKNIFVLPKCDPKDNDSYAILQRVLALEEKVAVHESLIMKSGVNRKQTYAEMVTDTTTRPVRRQPVLESCRLASDVPSEVAALTAASQTKPGHQKASEGDAKEVHSAVSAAVGDLRPVPQLHASGSQLASDVPSGGVVSRSKGANTCSSQPSLHHDASTVSAGDVKHKIPEQTGIIQQQNSGMKIASQERREIQSSSTNSQSGQWTTVSKFKEKSKKGHEGTKPKPAFKVHGNVKGSGVRGAPLPKRDFFVSRVLKETTDEQLLNYITSNGVSSAQIMCVSNPDSAYRSYRLSVPVTEKDKVMDGDMWPYGICVQRWWRKKNQSVEK